MQEATRDSAAELQPAGFSVEATGWHSGRGPGSMRLTSCRESAYGVMADGWKNGDVFLLIFFPSKFFT